jgi:hypothetical protein
MIHHKNLDPYYIDSDSAMMNNQHILLLVVVIFVVGWFVSQNMGDELPPVLMPKAAGAKENYPTPNQLGGPSIASAPPQLNQFGAAGSIPYPRPLPSMYSPPPNAPVGNNQLSQHVMHGVGNFLDDRSLHETTTPQGDTWFPIPKKIPQGQQYPSGCLLGCNNCFPNCSGEGNRCGVVAPVPSPAWQPQSASTVQYRLRTGNYVPSYCPQGRRKCHTGFSPLRIYEQRLVK